jgi:hypothetical protein
MFLSSPNSLKIKFLAHEAKVQLRQPAKQIAIALHLPILSLVLLLMKHQGLTKLRNNVKKYIYSGPPLYEPLGLRT